MPDIGDGTVRNRRRKKYKKKVDSKMDSKTVAMDEIYTDRSEWALDRGERGAPCGAFWAVNSQHRILVMPFSARYEMMPKR